MRFLLNFVWYIFRLVVAIIVGIPIIWLSVHIFILSVALVLYSKYFFVYKMVLITGCFFAYAIFFLLLGLCALVLVPEEFDYSYKQLFEKLRKWKKTNIV
ncbi:hypothetical protein ENFAE_25590 [Enterococcus faecalis]|nr:hypothetical protein ENFAE_25590 [Enterococcus faecalis]